MRWIAFSGMLCFALTCFGQIGVAVGNSQSYSQSAVGNLQLANTVSSTRIRVNSSNSWFITTAHSSPSILLLDKEKMAAGALPGFSPDHFGFFCKIESSIERKSGISPRFRLGSAEYVDGLEGKYTSEVRKY